MITVIDYGIGNLGSIGNALDRLGYRYELTDDASRIGSATTLILPGVGAAGEGMANLSRRGLDLAIRNQAARGTPILGICLGMQLLFTVSDEGNVACLDIIPGRVKRFSGVRRIPQIGWNTVDRTDAGDPLWTGLPNPMECYFVNSYYCIPDARGCIAGITEYGGPFPSVVVRGAIVATQFHPEKSGAQGLVLLRNFLRRTI